VAPQIRVPINEDTVARSMAGEDVQLTYALAWLDDQQHVQKTPAATPTQKSSQGIVMGVIALGVVAVVGRRK
jgi:carboxyl-terminal processing protease